jgi:hypothetical protein
MRKVSKSIIETAKKYNLLYDGKAIPKKLNKLVNPFLGRTYVVTKHTYWVTDGDKGIFNIVNRIIARDEVLRNAKKQNRKK